MTPQRHDRKGWPEVYQLNSVCHFHILSVSWCDTIKVCWITIFSGQCRIEPRLSRKYQTAPRHRWSCASSMVIILQRPSHFWVEHIAKMFPCNVILETVHDPQFLNKKDSRTKTCQHQTVSEQWKRTKSLLERWGCRSLTVQSAHTGLILFWLFVLVPFPMHTWCHDDII